MYSKLPFYDSLTVLKLGTKLFMRIKKRAIKNN